MKHGLGARRRGRWAMMCIFLLMVLAAFLWPARDARAQSLRSTGDGMQSAAAAATASAASAGPRAGSTAMARVAPGAQTAKPEADAKGTPSDETAQALRVVLGLTVLAVLPALVVCLTSFLRIIVVLSILRQAIGMNETPPNTVLIGLALFLTLFTMSPVLQKLNHEAFEPFMAGTLTMQASYDKGIGPLREFMVRQTREADLSLMVELSKAPSPQSMDDIGNVQLIPGNFKYKHGVTPVRSGARSLLQTTWRFDL